MISSVGIKKVSELSEENRLEFDVVAVLEKVGLESSFADALEDKSWDKNIQAEMQEGLSFGTVL